MNLQPTHSYKKGEIIQRKSNPNNNEHIIRIRKETVWEYGTDYEDSFNVEEQLVKVLTQLKGREQKINEICKKYNLKCMFMIVITMNDGYTPTLIMNTEIIEFVHSIEAEIHFDLYANPYQSEL